MLVVVTGIFMYPMVGIVLIETGEDNLVCMTRMFDTIHEEPLRTDDFGDGKQICEIQQN